MNSKDALQKLIEGNKRYVSGDRINTSPVKADHQPILEQKPFAVVLGCSDSRVPAEIVFDQGLGDLFVIRVAGNIVAPSQIGSVEFACQQFGTQLVVVLGHTMCGAISATVDSLLDGSETSSPNLAAIVDQIVPAAQPVVLNQADVTREQMLLNAMKANVDHSVASLESQSQIIRDLVAKDKLRIVGAEYCVESGEVKFH